VVTVSLRSDAQRKIAGRILTLLGWKLNGNGAIEPGAQPSDGPNQRIPALLGIDEVAMQEALTAGGTFQFTIPSEDARLIGDSMLVNGFNDANHSSPILTGTRCRRKRGCESPRIPKTSIEFNTRPVSH
jgi:hypothetical protein